MLTKLVYYLKYASKLKPFGALLSRDIVVSVGRLLTEAMILKDNKTANGLGFKKSIFPTKNLDFSQNFHLKFDKEKSV